MDGGADARRILLLSCLQARSLRNDHNQSSQPGGHHRCGFVFCLFVVHASCFSSRSLPASAHSPYYKPSTDRRQQSARIESEPRCWTETVGGGKLQAARSSNDNDHGRDPHPPRLRMLMQLLPVRDHRGRGGRMQVSWGLAHKTIGRLAIRRGTKIQGQQGTWQRQAFLGWRPGHRH